MSTANFDKGDTIVLRAADIPAARRERLTGARAAARAARAVDNRSSVR